MQSDHTLNFLIISFFLLQFREKKDRKPQIKEMVLKSNIRVPPNFILKH